jgi:choline-sulfatase
VRWAAGLLAVAVLGLLGGCRKAPAPAEPRRGLNVVLIVVDTLRADRLGVYGYGRPTSPRLDEWAARSTVFTRAYSHAPWTGPSIASFFTSLEPKDHGIASWKQPLDPAHLTLAEHLKASGYRTSAVVSHGILAPHYQFNQGFDTYDTSLTAGRLPREATTAREVTDLGLAATGGSQPFFLWLHYFDPHDAYLAHEGHAFGDRDSDRYDSEIAFTDAQIGRFLDGLRERGLAERTVVALVADHGEEFGDHGGFRHSKTLYDELLRIPFLLHVPGLPAGRVERVVRGIDVAPTLLEVVGVPVPAAFAGRAVPWTAAGFALEADRVHVAETQNLGDQRAILTWPWKLIEVRNEDRVRLFDLAADPGEQRNLWKERPDVGQPLRERLSEHYRQRRVAPEAAVPSEIDEAIRSLGYTQ